MIRASVFFFFFWYLKADSENYVTAVGNLPADFSSVSHVGGNEEGSQTFFRIHIVLVMEVCLHSLQVMDSRAENYP